MTYETDMEEQLERMRSLIHLNRDGQMGAVDFLSAYGAALRELYAIHKKYMTQLKVEEEP